MPTVTSSTTNNYVEYIDVFVRQGIVPSAGVPNMLLCFDTDEHSDPLDIAASPDSLKLYQKVCFYCKKGTLVVEVNEKTETIQAGDLFTVMPESVMRVTDRTPELEYYAMVIYPQLSSLIYKDLGITYSNAKLSQRHFLSAMSTEQIQNTYRIYNEIKQDILLPEYKYQMVYQRGLLNAIYVENINIHKYTPMSLTGDENSRQYDIYCKFLTALNKHAQEHRNVLYYANLLGISSKYLSFVCISYSKKNASTWIDDAVIQKAKVLMTVHKYSISQVSEMLNFQTASSFRRFFKRVTGITATEYLNTHTKKVKKG